MANFVVLHEIGTKKGVFLKSCGSFLGFLISGRMQVRIHARFGAILPAEPDRPVPLQIADHDAVGVPLADRDLVDADRAWRWRPCSLELLLHVLLVEFLDGAPIQVQLAGDVLDRRGPTAPAHKERKALGVEGVVGEPRQLLLLHFAATPAAAPDGARSPDRFWCLPPRGLVPGAACDRRFGARADRRPHRVFFPAAQVVRCGPWDPRTPLVLPPADEMRGSGTHPPTAALFPSPIHAKFSDLRKLRKALFERAFNS